MVSALAKSLKRVIEPVSVKLDKISHWVLFAMMIYSVVDVLSLKLFNYSLLGTVEMTALLMVICVFFSFAQTELEDGHIRVDFVYNKFSPKFRAICDFLTQLACTVLFAFIGWSSILNGFEKWETSELTMDLLIPLYPFAFIASIGCCLLCIVLLMKTIIAFDRVVNS